MNGNIETAVCLSYLPGFEEVEMESVLDNISRIFTSFSRDQVEFLLRSWPRDRMFDYFIFLGYCSIEDDSMDNSFQRFQLLKERFPKHQMNVLIASVYRAIEYFNVSLKGE